MAIAQDGSTQSDVTSGGTGTTLAVDIVISTAGSNRVLVAMASSGHSFVSGNDVEITVSGGGLTWNRGPHQAYNERAAEIWYATAANQLTSQTITATATSTGGGETIRNVQITVMALTGASSTAGVSQVLGSDNVPAEVTLAGTTSGSWCFVTGCYYNNGTAPTWEATCTSLYQQNPTTGYWIWAGKLTNASGGGSVTVGLTAPTSMGCAVAGLEIKEETVTTISVPGYYM